MRIITKDIWQAAFMLTKGMKLIDLKVKDKLYGEREASFIFEGNKNTRQVLISLNKGKAICELFTLQACMFYLKMKMYTVVYNNKVVSKKKGGH